MAGCTGNGTGGTTSSAPSDVPSTAPTSQVASTTAGFQHEIAVEPDEELRAELLAMMAEDQAVRTGIAPPGDSRTSDELFAAWDSVDAANAARMREVLEEYGRPGWSLVGEDGAEAAWVRPTCRPPTRSAEEGSGNARGRGGGRRRQPR